MSEEYEAALNAVREATAKFTAIAESYRAGKIGDDEYLAARNAYHKAEKVYELAYAKEAKETHEPRRRHRTQPSTADR